MSKRSGVSYVKQDEPSFLKQFKQRIAYKEGSDIETKKEELLRGDSDDEEHEDERPTVVVLKRGDLTEHEAETLRQDNGAVDVESTAEAPCAEVDSADESPPPDGRIVFKKPNKSKRQMDQDSDLKSSTKKIRGEKVKLKQSALKKVKNTSLLSFDEAEDEGC